MQDLVLRRFIRRTQVTAWTIHLVQLGTAEATQQTSTESMLFGPTIPNGQWMKRLLTGQWIWSLIIC